MVRHGVLAVLIMPLFLATPARGASSLSYRIPGVNDPADPIEVFLDLTSDRSNVASVGARLTYDPASVTLTAVDIGAGIPASWSIIFQDTTVAGQVDIVLTDQTSAAATFDLPGGLEVARLTFLRVGTNCNQSTYGFNGAAPDPGPPSAAFPENHYIIYVDTDVITEPATTASASGPVTEDHAFIRGNVNNRAAHALDIQDVVDLVSNLFAGFVPGYSCDAAFDVNNDSTRGIADVVALVQGVFGTTGFVIPPPNSANPGPGVPGVGTPDGGTIPSALGCAEGETCL